MMPPPADTVDAPATPLLLPPPAPLDGFSPEIFKARRDAMRLACPEGLVLVRGATEDEVPHGSASRYRQNNTFFYLTGIDTPGAYLALLPDDLPAAAGLREIPMEVREILFLPDRDATKETWTGPKLGPGEATEKATGIAKTSSANKLWPAVTGWVRRKPVVYTLAPYGEQARGTREYALMRRIADHAPVAQFRDASAALGQLRCIKSPAEIERLRQAIDATVAGQQAARAALAEGEDRREFEIEARVLEAFRARGATPSFAPIVGGGANATVLHYEDNAALLKAGDLVVVDVGAKVGHYCGDLTRTYPVGGTFGPRQREVYQLVLDAHRRAVADFQLGQDTLKGMSDRCKQFLAASPLRSVDGAGVERAMDHFMPHSLGHFLGLDVHDVGDAEPALPVGSVITIEPGIYLPSEGIGVRLEDDYLVTAQGLERLGSPLEIEIADVENAMRPRRKS